mmetsp:Transcript_8355/g.18063  ORF Transcript_8355/g.18063 Transcript_8355/m.18063 type:complete len:324 (-) Transcript_8355:585-1556(-)
MEHHPAQIISRPHYRPEFVASNAIVKDGEAKRSRNLAVPHPVMTLTPDVSAIDRFHPKHRVIPKIFTFGTGVEKLVLRRKLIVGHIGSACYFPRYIQLLASLKCLSYALQMPDHNSARYIHSQLLAPPFAQWRHDRQFRYRRIALENVVLLQYAQRKIPQQLALEGHHGTIAGHLIAGVDLVQRRDTRLAIFVSQTFGDARAALAYHCVYFPRVLDRALFPGDVDGVLHPRDIVARESIEEEHHSKGEFVCAMFVEQFRHLDSDAFAGGGICPRDRVNNRWIGLVVRSDDRCIIVTSAINRELTCARRGGSLFRCTALTKGPG